MTLVNPMTLMKEDNMQPDKGGIWFPAKRYGWGWGFPCAWQGWVVYAAFVAFVTGSAFLLVPEHIGAWYGSLAVAVVVLFALCFAKGEKPRWRWGGD